MPADRERQSPSGVTQFWTTNTYDLLSRVKQVTLPDQQTIKTDYYRRDNDERRPPRHRQTWWGANAKSRWTDLAGW